MNTNSKISISVKYLNFKYSKSSGFVLRDINVKFEPGKIYALLGQNGSGKTTLIKCLTQEIRDYCGNITISNLNNSFDISTISQKERAKIISVVSQQNNAAALNVFDTVMLGRNPYINISPAASDYQIVSKAIDTFSLNHLSTHSCKELSGGELQNVAIAQAFAQNTPIMCLDEPSNNLDVKRQHYLFKTLEKLVKEKELTIICVLHDINQAITYADELILMKNGTITDIATPNAITEELITDVYDTHATIIELENRKFVII